MYIYIYIFASVCKYTRRTYTHIKILRVELWMTDVPPPFISSLSLSSSLCLPLSFFLFFSFHFYIMSYIQLQRTRLRMMNKTSSVSSSSDLIVPSIEESLQDWLSRDNSCTYLLDICRCCNKSNCDNLQTLILGIQKLEEDARLAAGNILAKKKMYMN